MGFPEWLSRMRSFGSTSDDPSRLENGTEMVDFTPPLDRSEQIIAEIYSSSYECAICADNVTPADIQNYRLWHCLECYQIYHFECVKAINSSLLANWRCPTCRANQTRLNRPTCWCGGRPNACTGYCVRRGSCPHGEYKTCPKMCHPGPCNVPCSDQCATRPRPERREPNCWDRFCDRWQRNSKGCWTKITFLFTVLALVYVLLGVLLVYHIKWWTQPYHYPSFDSQYGFLEFLILMIGGIILLFGIYMLLLGIWTGLGELLIAALNLDSLDTKRRRKKAIKFWGGLLMLVIFIGILSLPFLGFALGPDIVWYNQMKDSCKGFNTRINMDAGLGHDSRFIFRSLSPNVDGHNCYLASRLEPNILNHTTPFQYFYRLSGSTNRTKNIAIDVDLEHREWRMLRLNDTELVNQWLAYDFRHQKSLPSFYTVKSEIIKSGIFTTASKNDTHIHIGGLGMSIQNMYFFLDHSNQEPFLRVYDTLGLKNDQVKSLLAKEWSSKSDDRVVMRTASFGHGQQRLDMCMKERDAYIIDNSQIGEGIPKSRRVTGFDDSSLVPFTIIAALRDWTNMTKDNQDN
ncbi:hypothetical protein EG329_011450 [Mollisiaceae sp. DMI_Dod_QoI]|nr:hypothetical protein EG329_011450 [Helotiales sp. DMI_Dod_QoI]